MMKLAGVVRMGGGGGLGGLSVHDSLAKGSEGAGYQPRGFALACEPVGQLLSVDNLYRKMTLDIQ